MIKSMKQSLSAEKGQALLIVLGLLAIGGLTITASLNHATTSLKASGIFREDMKGVYAASAGVEHALWSLQKGSPTANKTPDNINQMAVSIQTEDMGTFTLYLDDLIEPESGVHYDWIDVESNIVLVGGTTYNYTISVNRSEEAVGNIRLKEIGAVLPRGYTYVTDSPAGFPDNLSTDNPQSSGNTSYGAVWVKWLWNPGQGPLISDNHTQGFHIEGTGSTDGAYAWIITQSNDVGTIGEITGLLYRITSTATRTGDGATTAEIVADVILMGGTSYIFSWEISN
ncbi:MAG: hypothetical protein V3R96_07925 [Dehalococcoidales bacterium]